MRFFLIIAFLSCFSVISNAQKVKSPPKKTGAPKPSAPPPPAPTAGSTGNTGSAGVTGFRLLKIPVKDGFFLGMTRKEFDSVKQVTPASISGEKKAYPAKVSPFYSGPRLYALGFTIDSIFETAPTDILEHYKTRLGEPDKTESMDTTTQLPDKNDASVTAEYPVKTIQLTWQLQLHDVIITYLLADLRNGTHRTILTVRYRGNAIFWRMLKDQEMREGE